jgi:hypothetical protein
MHVAALNVHTPYTACEGVAIQIEIMRTLFSILLLLCAVAANAQKYSRCIVYKYYGIDTAHKTIFSIANYNDQQKVTYIKTFGCLSNPYMSAADTGCYQREDFIGYNDKGLMQDSLSVYTRGDTVLAKFFYDSKDRLRRREMYVTEKKENGRFRKTWEFNDYEYNSKNSVKTIMQEKNHDKWIEYNKHVMAYDEKGRILTDSSFYPYGGKLPASGAETVRWLYSVSDKFEYSKDGYRHMFYNGSDLEMDTKVVQTFDKQGRVVSDQIDVKPFGVVTNIYGYYPEQRKRFEITEFNMFNEGKQPEIYQYVYE